MMEWSSRRAVRVEERTTDRIVSASVGFIFLEERRNMRANFVVPPEVRSVVRYLQSVFRKLVDGVLQIPVTVRVGEVERNYSVLSELQ